MKKEGVKMALSKVEVSEKEKVQAYYEKHHWKITLKRMLKDWRLYVMLLPLVIVFILWRYLPMYGLAIAFRDYDAGKGILDSNFVGLAGFEQIVKDPLFWRAVKRQALVFCHFDGYTAVAGKAVAAARTATWTKATYHLALVPYANLTQLDTGVELTCQILDKLTKVYTVFCRERKDKLGAVKGVFGIYQLHI